MTVGSDLITQYSYAYGEPLSRGVLRHCNEDFVVVEELGFEPEGDGEHVYLDVTKNGENTGWVASQIASFAGVRENDVGYCGRKDRHAVTRQWFSVYLPTAAQPDWHRLEAQSSGAKINLHRIVRGTRKLRRGQHSANHFEIVLRQFRCENPDRLEKLLHCICQDGVPNYFGEQRFGRNGNNLLQAAELLNRGKPLQKKHHKGMVVSAARSYLFNLVLHQRVSGNTWCSGLDGDVDSDLGPTGPLWGRGRSLVTAATAELESSALEPLSTWCQALEHVGLSQERRALVSRPVGFDWEHEEGALRLRFSLPPGQFATSVLREFVVLESAQLRPGA